jgi:hypothetical protein
MSSGDLSVVGGHGEGVRKDEDADAPREGSPDVGADGLLRERVADGVVHLARRPLLGGDLLDVDETALLDPDQQRVDGPLGDVGEVLLSRSPAVIS